MPIKHPNDSGAAAVRPNKAPQTLDLIVIHSSDELYGADRVVRQVVRALQTISDLRSIELWLPTRNDQLQRHQSLFDGIGRTRVARKSMPIIRRKNMDFPGVLTTARKGWTAFLELLSSKPRIAYLATSACLLYAPLARMTGSRNVILHVQENWNGPERHLLGILALFCTQIICISSAIRNGLPSYLQRRAVTIENATAAPYSVGSPPDRSGRPIRVLMASRWNTWKGHRTLLTAWNEAGDNMELIILGGPAPEGVSINVPALVGQVKNSDSITVVGEVREIGPYIDACDVVVVPSDKPEPFGLVAIEAFARGKPVIGSDGGGLAHIIEHGKNGWKFQIGNARELARVLLEIDRSQLRDFGHRALGTYRDRYSEESYTRQIVQFMTQAAKSN